MWYSSLPPRDGPDQGGGVPRGLRWAERGDGLEVLAVILVSRDAWGVKSWPSGASTVYRGRFRLELSNRRIIHPHAIHSKLEQPKAVRKKSGSESRLHAICRHKGSLSNRESFPSRGSVEPGKELVLAEGERNSIG